MPTEPPVVPAEQQAAAVERGPSEELREAAAHGVRWSLISRPAVELIQLGSIVVLARLIAPAEFGRFAIALIAQEIAYGMVAAGLSNALVQRKTADREHLQTGLALGLIAGLTLAVITLLAASVVVAPDLRRADRPPRPPDGSAVPDRRVQRRPDRDPAPAHGLQAAERDRNTSTVARVVVCIGLALAGLGGEALVLGVLVGPADDGDRVGERAPAGSPPVPQRGTRPIDYGLPVSLSSIRWIGFSNVDYAIIGARLGPLQTGFYFRAYTVAVEYENKISVVMRQVGFPVLAPARTPPN